MSQPIRTASARRALTHPMATSVWVAAAAAAVCLMWMANLPVAPTLAWAVLALAAGYAVSGSV